ncbi:MAG: hypothetical protein QG603_596 [Patescibacteria group bacterium]|nr:hypothetical protein [Patescibacteria group bacterium]
MKRKILLYYAAIVLSAMIIGGFYPLATGASIIQNLFFLPVAIMLWVAIFRIKRQKIAVDDESKMVFGSKKMLTLLIYSTLASSVLTVGAILHISNFKEALANLMFLPVTVQLIFWFLPKLKSPKKVK